MLKEVARVTRKTDVSVLSRVKARISIDLQRAAHRALNRRRQQPATNKAFASAAQRVALETDLVPAVALEAEP